MCVGEEDTSQQTAGIKLARRVRKGTKGQGLDNKKNGAGTIASQLVTMRGM